MHTSIDQLKKIIYDKIEHTFLNKYVQKPVISNEKLYILANILDKSLLPPFRKKRYIITTMLVQIALDTHDLVPESDEKNKINMTTKQLTVLAGDYYSGLYYLLLAEIEDYEMIHILATAIKEINENKMKLYYKEAKSFQEYVHIIKKVESKLIVRLAEYAHPSSSQQWIGDVLITNRLLKESRNYYKKRETPIISHWLKNSNETTLSAISSMESIIEQNMNNIEELIKLDHFKYKDIVYYILNENMFSNSSVVREG